MDIKKLNEELGTALEIDTLGQEDKWLNRIKRAEEYLKINYDYINLSYSKDEEGYIVTVDSDGELGFGVNFKCNGDRLYSSIDFEKWVPNNGHVLFDALIDHLMILLKIELILKGLENTSVKDRIDFPND